MKIESRFRPQNEPKRKFYLDYFSLSLLILSNLPFFTLNIQSQMDHFPGVVLVTFTKPIISLLCYFFFQREPPNQALSRQLSKSTYLEHHKSMPEKDDFIEPAKNLLVEGSSANPSFLHGHRALLHSKQRSIRMPEIQIIEKTSLISFSSPTILYCKGRRKRKRNDLFIHNQLLGLSYTVDSYYNNKCVIAQGLRSKNQNIKPSMPKNAVFLSNVVLITPL